MIQRIQSIYLLVSAILGVITLSTPLGYFCTAGGERYADLYNLWLRMTETNQHTLAPWALFAILLTVTTETFFNIFLFRQRALQMRITSLSMILIVGYYIYFVFFAYMFKGDGTFTPSLTAALPIVSLILDYLAFRGILKDELLVKSLDRLR